MKNLRIPLDEKNGIAQKEDILYRLNFLKGVTVLEEASSLNVFFDEDGEDTREKIIEIVKDAAQEKYQNRVIFESSKKLSEYNEDIYNALLRSKMIGTYGNGLASFGQEYTALMDYFDSKFADLATMLGAENNIYPVLMPVEILERCNYFESFPQYINFVTHIEDNFELLNSFNSDWRKRDSKGLELDHYFKRVEHVLSPAVCFHCYKRLESENIDSNKGKVITAKNRCFRYESKNMRTLERLRDFTMREIVFIGESGFVTQMRSESINFVSKFVDDLGLQGIIELANDPFFTKDAKQKKIYQRGFELKYELRLSLPYEKKTLAVGSFNIHEDYFGRIFNINVLNKGYAYTGCTAFGIERWVFAFLAQYGPEKLLWPEEVQRFVKEKF